MSARWSLRGRLTRRILVAVTLGWLISLFIGVLVIAHEMGELLDDNLKQAARLALGFYAAGGIDADLATGADYAVRVTGLVGLQPTAPWPPLPADGMHEVPGWRIYRISDRASGLAVEWGQSTNWRWEELLETVRAFLLLMLPVLATVLLAIRHAVGTVLVPASGFADVLRRRAAADLSPVVAPDLPSELAPIPQALNGYLQRIEALLDAERHFATNAAHELRTPLATASAQAQMIAAGKAGPEAPRQMVAAIDRLAQLVERLLQLSRAETEAGSGASCDLVRVVRLMIADRPEPRPQFDDGDFEAAEVQVDADVVALMVANLLRNAGDHGTGPAQVKLRAGPTLIISNPVGSEAEFRRGRFEKGAASGGIGLGLVIVETLARRNAIAVQFSTRAGRAEVVLRFPPAANRRRAGDDA